MADRRLKAVAEDDIASSDEDEDAQPVAAAENDLELDLCLERLWGPARGSSSGGGSLPEWYLALTNSQSFVEDALKDDRGGILRDQEVVIEGMGRAGGGGGGRDRDFLFKRAKVFDYSGLCNFTVTSTSVAEAPASLPNAENFSECLSVKSEDEMILWLMSNDGDQNPRDTNDGGTILGRSDTRAIDVEPRMDLTEDLIHLVFSFLSQKDLCRAGATCKQWQAASTHEEFWRCLNFENTQMSHQNFNGICRRYPNATELNISGVYNSDVLVMMAMTSLRRLEILILGKGQLDDDFFHALTNCPALKSLSICDSSLGNIMQEISVHHDRLCELHIMKCRVLRVSIRCHQLQILSLRRTSMVQALLTCPQLHVLDISSCHKLSDGGIRSAAMSCPLLATLDMSSCSCVSNETLREIAFVCPNLSVLDASNCPNISLESVRLPMLKDLKLHSCEGITSGSMSALSYSRMLEAVQLDNCGMLTSVSLNLAHLRSICLVHCRKFVDLNLQSSVLSYINVSNCSALHRISITSAALQKLVLQKLENLTTLSLHCPNLQEVDLSDCESLKNSVCEVFNNRGDYPTLKSLVLDNCESLTFVELNSSSLVSLSLIGCRSMTVLEISCPNLQTINLDGCDHLKRASFRPVGLESLNLGICPKLSILQLEASKMSVLELKGCGVLSQASICCPCLTSLDAAFCRQFMDDSLSTTAASSPHIESLVLSSCLSIGYGGLTSLHWLQRLTLLDLSYTFLTNLQPVFDTCSQLVILKLSACKYLSDSSLAALYENGALPALRELDLSYSSISQSAIMELLGSCINLVIVTLNGCANMYDLVWSSSDCHSPEMLIDISSSKSLPMKRDDEDFRKPEHLLEILNCIGCPNIKKVLIPSAACCFHLYKLNLNLSTNLKEVDIACFNLISLNLSNCSSLEILKLDCPRLTNLQLLACSMLEEDAVEAAISCCNMLETLNVQWCPKIPGACMERFRMVCSSLKRIQCTLSA